MQFHISDFFIGWFLMNAMPHLLVAQTEVRFLSLFGYSIKANYGYAVFNLFVALILFQIQYGLNNLFNHGLFLGALFILVAYIFSGRYFYKLFKAPTN